MGPFVGNPSLYVGAAPPEEEEAGLRPKTDPNSIASVTGRALNWFCTSQQDPNDLRSALFTLLLPPGRGLGLFGVAVIVDANAVGEVLRRVREQISKTKQLL